MNNSIHRISLDIHDTGSQVSISVKKGDTARSLHITLTENGKPYRIAEGCYAVFTAIKPDKNYLFNDCTIKDNVIIYDFTEQTVPVEGQENCEVILYDANNERITSPRFDIVVDDVVYNNDEIISSDEATALLSAIAEVKSQEEKAEIAAQSAAESAAQAAEDRAVVAEVKDVLAEAVATAKSIEERADAGEFNGADGYTPVKGVDYHTETERREFITDVLEELPNEVVNGTSAILNGVDVNKIVSGEDAYNVIAGIENTIGINGYKMLSITHAENGLSIDIELDDAKFEEANRAITNYAINDIVTIQSASFECDNYAISAMVINETTNNTIITVKPYSTIKNKFTNEVVNSKIALDGGGDAEDWFWVKGKSFGEPVGRTQGAFLAGMENLSIGRYTFGGGRQNILNGDGATAFGRSNISGYMSFTSGRGNTNLGGYVFGDGNKTEYSSSAFIAGSGNKALNPSDTPALLGSNNSVYGGYFPTLIGAENTSYDTGNVASTVIGAYNEIYNGQYCFATGLRHKVYGKQNFIAGAWNSSNGENNLLSGMYNQPETTAQNSGFIGKSLVGSGTEQLVVGAMNIDDPDAVFVAGNGMGTTRNNAFVVKKTGDVNVQGHITANGVDINDALTNINKSIEEIKTLLNNTKSVE